MTIMNNYNTYENFIEKYKTIKCILTMLKEDDFHINEYANCFQSMQKEYESLMREFYGFGEEEENK